MVNGYDIRQYNPAEYHRHLTAVFQGFSKFNSTIKENVGLGFVEKMGSRIAVETAVHLAEADAIIEALPNGLRTTLETPGFESIAYPGSTGHQQSPHHHGLSGGEVSLQSILQEIPSLR
jgi:ABC-type multidrug transport system fused ATPase/permease subunit